MLRAAMEDFGVPAGRAVIIGDTAADVEAGAAMGCRTLIVGEGGASFLEARGKQSQRQLVLRAPRRPCCWNRRHCIRDQLYHWRDVCAQHILSDRVQTRIAVSCPFDESTGSCIQFFPRCSQLHWKLPCGRHLTVCDGPGRTA